MPRKCEVTGCGNVALLNCMACGMGNCGQHGWEACPVCPDTTGPQYLHPVGPGSEVHALGFELATVRNVADVAKALVMVKEVQQHI